MLNSVVKEVIISIVASLVIISVGFLYRKTIAFCFKVFVFKIMKIGVQDVCDYSSARKSFASALEKGHTVKLMAIMGVGFLSPKDNPGRLHHSILGCFLSTRLKSDPNVRVLLLDPFSNYVSTRADELFYVYRS